MINYFRQLLAKFLVKYERRSLFCFSEEQNYILFAFVGESCQIILIYFALYIIQAFSSKSGKRETLLWVTFFETGKF